jgi:hypothetical protein
MRVVYDNNDGREVRKQERHDLVTDVIPDLKLIENLYTIGIDAEYNDPKQNKIW